VPDTIVVPGVVEGVALSRSLNIPGEGADVSRVLLLAPGRSREAERLGSLLIRLATFCLSCLTLVIMAFSCWSSRSRL